MKKNFLKLVLLSLLIFVYSSGPVLADNKDIPDPSVIVDIQFENINLPAKNPLQP